MTLLLHLCSCRLQLELQLLSLLLLLSHIHLQAHLVLQLHHHLRGAQHKSGDKGRRLLVLQLLSTPDRAGWDVRQSCSSLKHGAVKTGAELNCFM